MERNWFNTDGLIIIEVGDSSTKFFQKFLLINAVGFYVLYDIRYMIIAVTIFTHTFMRYI